MKELNENDLKLVSGGSLIFKQDNSLFFIAVTGDSTFYNTGDFMGMTASVSLTADHAENTMGNILLAGGSEQCYHDGHTIYSDVIPNRMMYSFYHGIPA